MKKIGSRISFDKHENYYTIIISSKIEKWKENAMLFWLICWSFCGLTFLYFLFFGGISSQEKITLLVLVVFWIYLELRIFKVYMWRVFGIEYIRIDADRITHKKSIKGYGSANYLNLDQIIDITPLPLKEKSISKVFNDSFWIIGSGIIQVKSSLTKLYIGVQLNSKDANQLSKEMMLMLRNLSNK